MNDYWLLLLEGAHIEAQLRQRTGIRRHRYEVPARVQQTIDRIRRERDLPPLYQKREAA